MLEIPTRTAVVAAVVTPLLAFAGSWWSRRSALEHKGLTMTDNDRSGRTLYVTSADVAAAKLLLKLNEQLGRPTERAVVKIAEARPERRADENRASASSSSAG
jgi:uncharacterized lipoprotein